MVDSAMQGVYAVGPTPNRKWSDQVPSADTVNIQEFFEKKAREGDSGFAIAYALLGLTHQQYNTSQQLARIGLGDASSGGKGALELIGMSLQKIASSIGDVGGAVSEAMDRSAG
jgi:hypothetical protein